MLLHVLDALVNGRGIVRTVVIPEGFDQRDITPALAKGLGVSEDSVRAALADTALFAAHFQQGRDLGDSQTLADIAAACGDDRDAALDYLNSPRDVAEVADLVHEVGRQGIGGVPFFIIDRRLAVSGAQPAAALVEALLQAARPA